MTGRRRGVATRRKKETAMQKYEQEYSIPLEMIIAFSVIALLGALLKGLVIGYFLGKKR